jgi:phage terminase large subunit-like protein
LIELAALVVVAIRPTAAATTAATAAIAAVAASPAVVNHKVGSCSFVNGHHTKGTTTSTIASTAKHTIDLVLRRVNRARESMTSSVRTINLDSPIRHVVSEWRSRFEVDGVPAELDKCRA